MDFILIANAWAAGVDNPTSKHRIALELARQGYRVLWVEGAGMRAPSLGSGHDRTRMLRKITAAWQGAREVEGGGWKGEGGGGKDHRTTGPQDHGTSVRSVRDDTPLGAECVSIPGMVRSCRAGQVGIVTDSAPGVPKARDAAHAPPDAGMSEGKRKIGELAVGAIWVLTPLLIPLPRFEVVRRLNGWLCAKAACRWARRLGFRSPVLINYVPVLAEAMRRWKVEGGGWRVEGGRWRVEGSRGAGRGDGAEVDGKRTSTINHQPLVARGEPLVARGEPSTIPPRSARVVYHCVDRWDAFRMYDSKMMADMDGRCCRYADVVIATSNELYDRCRRVNPRTHLLTHGVDYGHFAEALKIRCQVSRLRQGYGGQAGVRCQGAEVEGLPSDLSAVAPPRFDGEAKAEAREAGAKEGGRWKVDGGGDRSVAESSNSRPADLPEGRIVGFFGLLSEWVDQELVLAVAEELRISDCTLRSGEEADGKGTSVVLIGKADVDISRLQGMPNLHLLGPKPFAELPRYIAHFDVGIIPFVVNDLTRSVNPIKLREMMAAGCPVVSTALPEVEAYAGSGKREAGSGVSRRGAESAEGEGGSGREADSSGTGVSESSNFRIDEFSIPGVVVARTREEFVARVRERLERPASPEERRAISARVAGETWEQKVREMVAWIRGDG